MNGEWGQGNREWGKVKQLNLDLTHTNETPTHNPTKELNPDLTERDS